MPPLLKLYNLTSAFVPRSECARIFGDNSTHRKPNPWPAALRILHLLGMATDGKKHYRIARHYTIRLAISPQDDAIVQRLQGRDGMVMLACRILVDGGDDDCSVDARMDAVPKAKWRPYPVPEGLSAVGRSGKDGGYVLMEDMPKPLLEERMVSIAGMRDVGGDMKVCEIHRLFVDQEEDNSLPYLLVEMLAEHARASGHKVLRTAPGLKLGQAEGFFKKAGVASTASKKAAARRILDKATGKATGAWELDLGMWSGPAKVSVPR